jgi:protein-disulfide isomerase
MASRKEQRQVARAARARLAGEDLARARRQRLLRLGAASVLAAAIVIAVAIVISQSGDDSGGDETVEGVSSVQDELRGLEQQGLTLGDPDAKVTVVEFGDLQCPVCKTYSEEIIPEVIDGSVRDGEAKLEFRNWVIIGPDSEEAARAALAASEQGRYWSFITLFYANQGTENSGYVSDSFLESVAKGAGVRDLEQWNEDRESPRWDAQIAQTNTEAQQLGFTGTPSFLAEGPNGEEPLGTPGSASSIEEAIRSVG